MSKEFTKLVLKNQKVLFANLVEKKKFGKSITIEVSDQTVRDQITKWYGENQIGNGQPRFKEYTSKDGTKNIQFVFKLNEYTEFIGLPISDLGFESNIDLVARAYEYNNEFGVGITQVLSAVKINSEKSQSSDADLLN